MIRIIRKNQQVLMIIVSVFVIIAFVWLYNDVDPGKLGADNVATAYGRTLSRTDIERQVRMFQITNALGLFDVVQALAGRALDREQAIESYLFNHIVVKKEADDLEVHPTDNEVLQAIREVPAFQTEGRFDVTKYSQFLEQMLAPNGFTTAQLEEVMRDYLRFHKMRALLDGGVALSAAEARAAYDREMRGMILHVLRFSPVAFTESIEPSEEEILTLFEADGDAYRTEETRRVRYVRFDLDEASRALEGRERVQAMQKLADRAGEFTQEMLDNGADFNALAERFELEVKTSGDFARTGTDPAFEEVPAVVGAAFALSEADPNSDAITFKDGFYVLQLDHIEPSRPLELEAARSRVVADLKQRGALQAMETHAEAVRAQLREAVANGLSFAAAATAAGEAAEALPVFSLARPDTQVESWREIAMRAMELRPGEISDLTPTDNGGALVFLEKFEPVPDEDFARDQELVMQGLLEHKRDLLFQEWLRERSRRADVRML